MKYCFTLLFLGILTVSFSQNTFNCLVLDAETQAPLIGATVQYGDNQTTTTDEKGNFFIKSAQSTLEIKVSYIGFQSKTETITLETLIVYLNMSTSILDQIVITGSQSKKTIADEATTLEIIRPDFISKNNVTTLSDAVERVPGVQMIDDQVNIRSSGFSYGAGSRVGLIVDGLPLMGGLGGDIKWNFVPFENAAQVEVMKGASSVLYGASAMNGVVNVITAWPDSKPYTSVTLYGGEYDAPKSAYRQWWDEENRPMTRGVLFAHRSRTDKFDLVIGGNYHKRIEHLEDLEEGRTRFNWKTRYRLTDKINFGINGNVMQHSYGGFLVWQDADTNSLKHIAPFAMNEYITYSIDPHLTVYDPWNNKHSLTGRFFNVIFQRRNDLPNAPGSSNTLDYKFQHEFSDKMRLVAGLSYQDIYAEDPIEFIDTTGGIATFEGTIASAYAQMDMDFFENKLNVIVGLRGERINVDSSYSKTIPITRLSALYKPDDKNRIRMNFGQGYRLPSMLERFVSTPLFETGVAFLPTVNVVPNTAIVPEIGWSIELGYKRLFKSEYINGYADVALFSMDYWNLTEVVAGYHGEANTSLNNWDLSLFGLQMQNVTRGRIAGIELSTYINGKVASVPYRLWAGYTYTYPGDLDSIRANDMSYFGNLIQAMGTVDSTLVESILPYRSLHTGRIDFEIPTKWFALGIAANYNGYMWQMDDIFIGEGGIGQTLETLLGGPLVPGFKEFRETSKGGTWVFDTRVSVDLGEHIRLAFIVNNLLNREYALRPGRMNAPRSFNLKCQLTF